MDKNRKEQVVEELKQIFNSTTIVIVSHNKGLTVSQSRELRKQVKVANSNYQVTKNSLAKIATQETQFAELNGILKGPTSLAYSNDPVAIAKVLTSFAKDNEKIEILGGVMDSTFLDANALKQLATMPSLDELRGKIVGILKAPATKLAVVLQAPAAQLARVFSAYAKKNN